MSRIAYFDCPSGISGDMTLGALLDAGAERALLDATVEALGLAGEVRIQTSRQERGHLGAGMRTWGWAVQLYALRSSSSWGIGDLGDLLRLAEWSADQAGRCSRSWRRRTTCNTGRSTGMRPGWASIRPR